MKHHAHTTPPLDRPTVEFAMRLAPAACPDPRDSEREVWMKAGEHRLARSLLTRLENQEVNRYVQS